MLLSRCIAAALGLGLFWSGPMGLVWAQEAPTTNLPAGGGEAEGNEFGDGALDDVPPPVASSSSVAGTGSLTSQLGFYSHSDSITDGNPYIDEDLWVVEPIVIWDYNVSDDWAYSVELAYDRVSSASIERLSTKGAQSGASGDNYVGLRYGSRHRVSPTEQLDWHLGYSFEYDYRSIALGGGYSTRARDDSRSTSYSADAYVDSLDLIRWDGTEDGGDNRFSVAGSWSHYRLLSPKWNGELSSTLSYQSGFLATPYNPVAIEDGSTIGFNELDVTFDGKAVDEILPDTRVRGSLSGRFRRHLGERRALELGGRVYADDWGIFSVTFEPRYRFGLGPNMDLALGYRFYTQTASDYWSEKFTTEPEFRTQDPDLGELDAHTLTTQLEWRTAPDKRWIYGLNYTLRSDGLDYLWAFVNWRWSF
jgi:hypothetical protein